MHMRDALMTNTPNEETIRTLGNAMHRRNAQTTPDAGRTTAAGTADEQRRMTGKILRAGKTGVYM